MIIKHNGDIDHLSANKKYHYHLRSKAFNNNSVFGSIIRWETNHFLETNSPEDPINWYITITYNISLWRLNDNCFHYFKFKVIQ